MIPTLLLISVVTFLLGYALTDDPVASRGSASFSGTSADPDRQAALYGQQMDLFHLNKPAFYLDISSDCLPDTFYKVYPPWRKEKMKEAALECGSWEAVTRYENGIASSIRAIEALPDSTLPKTAVNSLVAALKTAPTEKSALLIRQLQDTLPVALPELEQLHIAMQHLAPKAGWGSIKIRWNGSNNQYHDWLTGKYSDMAGSPWRKVRYSLRVTFLINGLALFLALLIGLPIGVWISGFNRPARWGKNTAMAVYIIPVLLLGCMVRFLFATPGHAFFLPVIGGTGSALFYNPDTMSFGHWAMSNAGRLVLPILVLAVHFAALIALQMRTGMQHVMQQDFIKTARMKGISERKIRWGHAFRNGIFPVITIFGAMLPLLITGAIIAEAIFSINGLGHTLLEAVLTGDFTVMMAIVMLSAFLTILGVFLADIIYAWADPRVRSGFEQNNTNL